MDYKKLIVWEKADDLAFQIYNISRSFPKEEQYGMTSQLRRAAISVPTNIVEGVGRQNKNETRQFINIALGSLNETKYLADLSKRLNLLSEIDYQVLERLMDRVGALLWKSYKSF